MSEGSKPEPATDNKGTGATAKPQVRQWRVGTFSMGFTLIALGLALLLDKAAGHALSYENLLRYWPLILVVLGTEILLYNFVAGAKGRSIRVTYDFLSIILVIILLFAGIALTALESVGLIDLARRNFNTTEQTVEREKTLPAAGIASLYLEDESGSVKIISYSGEEIVIKSQYRGMFLSREDALAFAEEQPLKTEQRDDRVFINLYRPLFNRYIDYKFSQEVTVFVPEDIDVTFQGGGGRLQLFLPRLESNWEVRQKGGFLEVWLEEVNNAGLTVELAKKGVLKADITWQSREEREDYASKGEPYLRAAKTWGTGAHSLFIRQESGTVAINMKES